MTASRNELVDDALTEAFGALELSPEQLAQLKPSPRPPWEQALVVMAAAAVLAGVVGSGEAWVDGAPEGAAPPIEAPANPPTATPPSPPEPGLRLVRLPYPTEWLHDVQPGMVVGVYQLGRHAPSHPMARAQVASVNVDGRAVVLWMPVADAETLASVLSRGLPVQLEELAERPRDAAKKTKGACREFTLISGGEKTIVQVDEDGVPCP